MPTGYIPYAKHRAAIRQVVEDCDKLKEQHKQELANLQSQLAVEVARNTQMEKDNNTLRELKEGYQRDYNNAMVDIRHYERQIETIQNVLQFRAYVYKES